LKTGFTFQNAGLTLCLCKIRPNLGSPLTFRMTTRKSTYGNGRPGFWKLSAPSDADALRAIARIVAPNHCRHSSARYHSQNPRLSRPAQPRAASLSRRTRTLILWFLAPDNINGCNRVPGAAPIFAKDPPTPAISCFLWTGRLESPGLRPEKSLNPPVRRP